MDLIPRSPREFCAAFVAGLAEIRCCAVRAIHALARVAVGTATAAR